MPIFRRFFLPFLHNFATRDLQGHFRTVAILAQGKPSGYSTTLAVLLNRFMGLGMSLRR